MESEQEMPREDASTFPGGAQPTDNGTIQTVWKALWDKFVFLGSTTFVLYLIVPSVALIARGVLGGHYDRFPWMSVANLCIGILIVIRRENLKPALFACAPLALLIGIESMWQVASFCGEFDFGRVELRHLNDVAIVSVISLIAILCGMGNHAPFIGARLALRSLLFSAVFIGGWVIQPPPLVFSLSDPCPVGLRDGASF